jgi:6-pyruvoyltetrahydropterin/6-carboxytetrahydropterin synthase
MYLSTKSYGQEQGLSCAFRQWRANHSHCQLVHGYALGFKFVFSADRLDERGWVMDFGGLKALKDALKATFDHKIAVAYDDPDMGLFMAMERAGVAEVRIFHKGVGVERFAEEAWEIANSVINADYSGAVSAYGLKVVSCECSEHAGNSAIYIPEKLAFPSAFQD